jgi:hypothetical protein
MSSTLPIRLDFCRRRAMAPSTVSSRMAMKRYGTEARRTAGPPRYSMSTNPTRSGIRLMVMKLATALSLMPARF